MMPTMYATAFYNKTPNITSSERRNYCSADLKLDTTNNQVNLN